MNSVRNFLKGGFFSSFTILIGNIIGAGIFGLPYVISKSGLLPGLIYFFVLGGIVILVHLFFGEIVLRTAGKNRMGGYAKQYLGEWARVLILVSTIIGLIGSLLAYAIISGGFLQNIFSTLFPAANSPGTAYFVLFFIAILSFFIFRGMKEVVFLEIFTNIAFSLIIFAIFFLGLPKINLNSFSLIDGKYIFLPFGVIMFSMLGWTAIPEIVDILKTKEEKKNLKKIIILGTIFPIFIYLIFSMVVWGVCGKGTTTDSLSGLIPYLGPKVILFGAMAAVMTLADSFLIIGVCLRNTLVYDLKFPKLLASLFVCATPTLLFLAGFQNFISIIGFIGTILGVVDGVAIVLIFQRAKKNFTREPEYSLKVPSFLIFFLILIFIIGAVTQILYNQ